MNPADWVRVSTQYFTEVKAEGKKVTWLTVPEARAGTIGVVILVTIFTVFLGLVDFGLSKIVDAVIR